MELAGHSDLQGRSAYQPIIINENGREIAYVGHHTGSAMNPLTGNVEPNGTSIVDVTDPGETQVPLSYSGLNGGRGRRRRRSDGARLQRQRVAARGAWQVVLVATQRLDRRMRSMTSPIRPTLLV